MTVFRMRSFPRWACACLMMALAGSLAQGQDDRPLVGPATPDEIAALVKALGDPSYAERTYATRRLCGVGPSAGEALRAAASGDDAEVAMRAKQLLAVFDQLLFAGVEVTLAFSRSSVAWSEPVDLIVTVENKSAYPARVSFDVDPAGRSSRTADARQVIDVLDLADWLMVRAPDGKNIELRVDDLNGDATVLAAVQERAAGSVGSVVPAGGRVELTLANFNRGWARYPLLDKGNYTVMLDYTPDWTDSALLAARAGRVSSNAAVVQITEAAPPTVARDGSPSRVFIEQVAEGFVARFENRTDRAVILNTNFGMAPPFAVGQWVLEAGGDRREIGLKDRLGSSFKDYQPAGLVEIAPGQSAEVARLPFAEAQKVTAGHTPQDAGAWEIHFSYANLCDRAWQIAQGGMLLGNADVPAILREPLPPTVLGTRLTSNRLPLRSGG